MTCFLCACGTAIYYDSVHNEYTQCTGCGTQYAVDRVTGKLQELPALQEFNLDRRDPLRMR